jgi:hypothetical protein
MMLTQSVRIGCLMIAGPAPAIRPTATSVVPGNGEVIGPNIEVTVRPTCRQGARVSSSRRQLCRS